MNMKIGTLVPQPAGEKEGFPLLTRSAGARRHAGGASARFRQDIKARVDAYMDAGSVLFA